MGRYYFYQTRRFGYAMKFADEGHYVGNVLNHVAANNLIEFIVGKRIRDYAKIVDDVGVATMIRIYSYGTGLLVLTTSDVKYLFLLTIRLHPVEL